MSDGESADTTAEALNRVADIHSSYHGKPLSQFKSDLKTFLGGDIATVGPSGEGTETQNDVSGQDGVDPFPQNLSVRPHIGNLQQLMGLCEVRPETGDFVAAPIQLSDEVTLPWPELPGKLQDIIQMKIALKEQEANKLLGDFSEKCGDYSIVHAACREFFAT